MDAALKELGGLAVESGVDDVVVLAESGAGNAHAAHLHDRAGACAWGQGLTHSAGPQYLHLSWHVLD